MKTDDKKWAEELRKKMEDYEVAPSSGLWDRIESSLPRRRRPMAVVWRVAAAAACVAVVAGAWRLLSPPGGEAERPVAVAVAAAPAAPSVGEAPARAAEEKPAAPERRVLASAFAPSVAEDPEVPVLAVAAEEPEETEEPARAVAEEPARKPTEAELSRRFVGDSQGAAASAARRSEPAAGRTGGGDGGRWRLAVAATGNFSGGNSSTEGFSPLFRSTFGVMPTVVNGENEEQVAAASFRAAYNQVVAGNIDESTTTDDTYSFPMSYSVELRYMLTDRWGLDVGVSYSSASTERRSGSGTSYYLTKQKAQFVGVPVGVSFTVLSSRRFTLYATAGGTVEKCVSATKKDILVAGDYSSTDSHKSDLGKRPWQWSLNAGLGAQFNITDNYGIFVEPEVVCDLSDDDALPLRRRKDWSPQLTAGFRLSY